MAKEYIEREALIRYAEKQRMVIQNRTSVAEAMRIQGNMFRRCVEVIPTADVVEVKHGEWIEDGYAEKPCVCSYCGEEARYISRFEETFDYDWEENLQSTGYEEIREYIRTPYCPNCGAKMDGAPKERGGEK